MLGIVSNYKALYEKERQWRHDHMTLVINRLDIVEDQDQCKDCGGSGIKTYGTTGTYRAGAGGCTPTGDVCDQCWGSGRASKAWPSHRSLNSSQEPK